VLVSEKSTAGTSRDAFLDGRIYLHQSKNGFRSGMEAVFLAAACPAQPGEHVLEAGCGSGAASLCLLARVRDATVTGVDIDADMAALARANASANGMADAFVPIVGDITSQWQNLEAAGLSRESYDHVMANPPFYLNGRSRPSADAQKARARAMDSGSLDVWLRFLSAATKPGGTCTVIYTTAGLPELLDAFRGRFGGLRLMALHSKAGSAAIRVVVRGTKGSRAPLTIEPGFALHEENGAATAEADAILRGANKLF
jgi:tRNA1(Val) A37 N6-methylase TrmN6